jgi:transposase InsO family protein
VNLIGPWNITRSTNQTYKFLALNCVDRVTGLAELIRIDNKESAHVADKFAECWLSQYPCPIVCCHDDGGEFTGWEFQKLISDFGIKDKPTTSRNPAANGICERMHRQIGNVLRIKVHKYPPRTLGDAQALMDEQLAAASHSIRTNVSLATGYSPGALAFHRDMFLDVPYVADLLAVRERRQLSVDNNLCRANAK